MKILKQNSNSHKGVVLWAKSINDFGNFGRHFQCATSAKILAAMYARVPQAMAQFVLKIEKIGSFRLDYEYEIEYEYDFRISDH